LSGFSPYLYEAVTGGFPLQNVFIQSFMLHSFDIVF